MSKIGGGITSIVNYMVEDVSPVVASRLVRDALYFPSIPLMALGVWYASTSQSYWLWAAVMGAGTAAFEVCVKRNEGSRLLRRSLLLIGVLESLIIIVAGYLYWYRIPEIALTVRERILIRPFVAMPVAYFAVSGALWTQRGRQLDRTARSEGKKK